MAGIRLIAGHILAVKNGINFHAFYLIYSAEDGAYPGCRSTVILDAFGALAHCDARSYGSHQDEYMLASNHRLNIITDKSSGGH